MPPSIQCAIGQITIERPSDVKLLVKSESCNDYAAVSPDGRWMAYDSNVSGRAEIYVERYPELGNRQQISTGGGRLPLWSRDGRELFFSSLDGRQMLAVPVQSGTTLVAGRPQVLFEFAMLSAQGEVRPYDIAPDGRFLIIRSGQADSRQRHAVEHDRRAELVRGAEASGAGELSRSGESSSEPAHSNDCS